MSDYKLVPVEPTHEMIEAGKKEVDWYEHNAIYCYQAMLAAAPAVQGEPVATIHVDGSFVHVAWRIPAPSRCAMDVYTAPQPAEQQPELAKYQPCGCVICTCEHETQCQGCGGHHCGTHPVGQFPAPAYMQPAERQAPADYSLTPVPDELFAAEFKAWWEQHGQFCRAGGGDYECTFAFEAWRYLYPRLVKLQTAAAEQQPGLQSPPDDPLGGLEHRADGESNFYTLSRPTGNWVARIQFNGELHTHEQERILNAMLSDRNVRYGDGYHQGYWDARQKSPDVAGLVEAAEAALGEIEGIMQEAYNSAHPVCCGRPGSECCGSPEPEWEETDQRMMDRLAPHQKALRDALAAHRQKEDSQ